MDEALGAMDNGALLDLRNLIDIMTGPALCVLPDASVEFANQPWHAYTGRSPEQWRAGDWRAAIHPDDVTGFNVEWNAVRETSKPLAAKIRIRRADGQYRRFAIRTTVAVSQLDGNEPALRVLIACEDLDQIEQAESALHRSEELFRVFLENSPSPMFLKDREGKYLYTNREFTKTIRGTREQVIGKSDEELFSPEEAAAFQSNDRRVIELGAPMEFEEVTLQEDGLHTNVIQKFPLLDTAGYIHGIGGITTDVTERKQEESARRYSEERHRLVLETASDAVVSMDQTGIIQAANAASRRIFGYEPGEMVGKPLTVLMPEFMRELHEKGFSRYLATGQRHINWQGTELTARRKNGDEFPVEVSFGELNSDGHKLFSGFIRDISERKLAEGKLRASERTLRELTETIPQMLWSAESSGAIDYCNRRVLDYSGLAAEQIHGDGWLKSVHRDDLEKMTQAWAAAVSTGEPFQYEFRCRRAIDNSYRWCITSALPLRDQSGQVIKWFGSVVDLHDWKEAQTALQTTQAELAQVSRLTTMGELAASIAHEVNQPLTAVTNNASACLRLLASRNLEPEVLRRVLEEIVSDGTRASAVIARIRAFLKKKPAEMIAVDMNEVIHETIDLASRELSVNRVRMKLGLTQTLPFVLADRVQLQQVLLNLFINAIEAMTVLDDQSRFLHVDSRIDESGGVLIAVRDVGTGLGSEPNRVFTPFYTTKANGMGMGLSISRSLVEGHGGRLWAAPNSPRGSVFSFTLPAAGGSLS